MSPFYLSSFPGCEVSCYISFVAPKSDWDRAKNISSRQYWFHCIHVSAHIHSRTSSVSFPALFRSSIAYSYLSRRSFFSMHRSGTGVAQINLCTHVSHVCNASYVYCTVSSCAHAVGCSMPHIFTRVRNADFLALNYQRARRVYTCHF